MMRGRAVFVLVAVLSAAGCASAPPARDAINPHATRSIPLGDGLALPAGPTMLSLPPEQRFRFVPPDSLVRGVTSEDVQSARQVSDLRSGLSIVLHSQAWRESTDSAGFEIAVFIVDRTYVTTEMREEQVVSSGTTGLPRCDLSRMGNQPRCTNDPGRTVLRRVSVRRTTSRVLHVIRRRSDGAVRFWAHPTGNPEAIKASVARDLLRLFLTPEG